MDNNFGFTIAFEIGWLKHDEMTTANNFDNQSLPENNNGI
jgi:hypothetical protein